jgi:lipoate-protein ligase A
MEAGPCHSIRSTNQFIMERHRALAESLLAQPVSIQGTTDLVLGDRKFSGNAQRRRQGWLLFHGTFLLRFDSQRLGACLRLPPRQPEYRGGRSHADFVTGLDLGREVLQTALRECWDAQALHVGIQEADLAALIRDRYGRSEWNLRI